MKQSKIKILGIAPYDGMKTLMQNVAKDREDLILDVYVGDLKEGVKIAQQYYQGNYDVIISRGGTADLLRKSTSIPVVEIVLSVYDILRAIKLSEVYAQQYAIVGFPSIAKEAFLLCDLLQYNVDIYTIHSLEELDEILQNLKAKGYRMVLGDMVTHTTAKKMGMNAMLITSGIESVENAFNQAVNLSKSYSQLKSEMKLLTQVISGFSTYIALFNSTKELYFSTLPNEIHNALKSLLIQQTSNLSSSDYFSTFSNVQGYLYSIQGKILTYQEENYYVFYIDCAKTPITNGKNGIFFSNKNEVEEQFYNTFSFSEVNSNLTASFENIAQAKRPIILAGEHGTEKLQAARWLYLKGSGNNSPFITIDFTQINDKSWGYLTNHYNSPLNDNGNTLFLKNIEVLEEKKWKQLLSIIYDSNLSKRNCLILSFVIDRNANPISLREFTSKLSCLTIYLSPLRERINEISSLSSLYLNTLNLDLAKQIIGFAPDAFELLTKYDWPDNYSQFQRVLYELAVITDTPYITKDNVEKVLDKESKIYLMEAEKPYPGDCQDINYEGTLDEISREIIKRILDKCNGNQSLAAKKLGISRTTLWRYLNKG
ncbi:MAG TPA: sigma-54-dependent transcriptional regulator [Clostridiales bacterium]|nr:sigma-54-dependent transcriptional regulator [Clostridiales bacterium]